MAWFRSVPTAILAGLMIALVPGCGKAPGVVSGKVTYQGKPLAMGTVFIVGSDGLLLTSPIGDDGTYRIENVPPGPAKVGVASPKPPTGEQAARAFKGRAPANLPPPPDQAKWIEIPETYLEPNTSGLTADIKPGANTHDIELK
jgi:hypothetical protein